jgi:hypothetical protein
MEAQRKRPRKGPAAATSKELEADAVLLHERMLQERRRVHLDEIINRLDSGQLDDADRRAILRILKDVRDGYDARAYFGIEHAPGARPHREAFNKWAVIYFLKLRALEPDKPEKQHRGIVTDETGLSDSRLRNVVRQYRIECASCVEGVTLQQIRDVIYILTN